MKKKIPFNCIHVIINNLPRANTITTEATRLYNNFNYLSELCNVIYTIIYDGAHGGSCSSTVIEPDASDIQPFTVHWSL